jgi:hypothetical protein
MRKELFTTIGLAGLLAALLVEETAAAQIEPPAPPTIAFHGRSIEQVYYYHGRYYPYHYNNRYYANRVYRHGHWRYY